MPVAPAKSVCAVCGQSLPSGEQNCPNCHASPLWQNALCAAQFVQDRLLEWERDRLISRAQFTAIMLAENQARQGLCLMAREGKPLPGGLGLPRSNRCWKCDAELCDSPSHCPKCGVPVQGDAARELRYWTYTCQAIKSHYDARRLPLSQAHARINDAKGRMAVLRSALEKQRQPVLAKVVSQATAKEPGGFATAVADMFGMEQPSPAVPPIRRSAGPAAAFAAAQPPVPRVPRRPLWEILLDPRSIQWLLGLGGALLVLGLVIWLATLGVFKDKLVVAAVLGLANAALLGGGWAVTGYTRYQTAGRALTLLACLVMPLNLWFYHANNLITLDGHLWVAALVCCVLYAASALVLRDPMFVYVLAGGVTMTGLLMLADMGKFLEIAAPATLLVVLGLIAVHVERAFPEDEGPFSRRRFGLAFFWSGQAILGAGLLLLMGAQIAGDWLYKPLFEPIYRTLGNGQPPEIVTENWGRMLALALVLAGTYTYAYSDLVVRRKGVYIYLGVCTLLWAEVLVIELLGLMTTPEVAIIALAVTALGANLFAPSAARWQQSLPPGPAAESLAFSLRPLQRVGLPLGLLLSTLPVLLGLVLHFRATYHDLNVAWPLPGGGEYQVGWLYVAAMVITAVSCRIGAYLYRHTVSWLTTVYFFGAAAATLLGAAGFLSVLELRTWDKLAPVLMVIPILYLAAGRLYRGHTPENPLTWVAQTATVVIVLAVLAASAGLTPQHVLEPAAGVKLNLARALVFAEAAVFYALAAGFRKQGINVYLCTLALCGAVWQLLQYWHVGPEYYTLTFALAGLALLIGYRLAMWDRTGLAEPAFQCANALMSLSFVAAALLTLSRMATQLSQVHWSLVPLLGGLAVVSLLAAWLARHAGWRRWYVVMAITEAALMFLAIHVLSHLSPWEKMEIFTLAVGAGLLVAGHLGWYREQERQEDMVSFSLAMGSLLVAVPLAIAVVFHRSQPHFSALNELGMLVAGLLLLATGFMFQIRSTTLTGGALLATYLVTLLLLINAIPNVQTAAIWMTIGGAVIFGTGILLSVYRDRLLTLPEQVKRREGVFRVLNWR